MNIAPGEHNFTIYRGDDISFHVVYEEGTTGNEVGKDLTGATLTAAIRNSLQGPVITTFTCTADADQSTNPGRLLMELPKAKSLLLKGTRYVYDLQVLWTDSTTQTLLKGVITVTRDVTQ